VATEIIIVVIIIIIIIIITKSCYGKVSITIGCAVYKRKLRIPVTVESVNR